VGLFEKYGYEVFKKNPFDPSLSRT